MNGSQPQQGQPGQQPQQPQMQRQPKLFRPEQMRALPDKFSAEEKRKWENGLTMLYSQMENNPPESQVHRDAYKKIHDFSLTLLNKMQQQQQMAQANAAAQQQRPQGQTPQQRPQGQPMQQQQSQQGGQNDGSNAPTQSSQGQQGQPGGGQPQNQQQAPRTAQQAQPSQQMRDHVNNFPYIAPPGSGAKAQEWINSMKDKYLKALVNMEHASATLKKMDAAIQARQAAGKPLSDQEQKDMQLKKDHMTRAHGESKRFVESFRAQQQQMLMAQKNAAAGGAQAQPKPGQPPQQIAVPPRPAMSLQQPANAGQNIAAQSEAVQAAMAAARQQQANGAATNAQAQAQAQAQQIQAGQQQQQQQVNLPQQSQPPTQNFPNIKQEPGSQPPLNLNIAQAQQPHIQQMQAQARAAQQNQQAIGTPPQSLNNTPQQLNQGQAGLTQTPTQPQLQQQPQSGIQTPISGTPAGPPKPLSQSDAIAHAHSQRTYSSQQTTSTPNVIASHSHPHPQRDSIGIKSNLMPIPKTLPQAVQGPPIPVNMGPNRPTMALSQSVLNQPGVPKAPGFKVEGDTERVLGKRKLDELVRQVTGGSGVTGSDSLEEGLGPEVEDVSFPPFPSFPPYFLY